MKIKYDLEIEESSIIAELQYLTNQIYKLLPAREEGQDWQRMLNTVILELVGMDSLLLGMHSQLFPLLCKLESLSVLIQEKDFLLYRKTIFECLSLVGELINRCQDTKA